MMELKGKKVLVVGLGKSGLAAALFLRRRGAQVTVSDVRSAEALAKDIPALLEEGIMVEAGGHGLLTFRRQDLIVVSPGVPLDTPELVQARNFGLPVIGELELAARFLKGKILAITGSNGKTTTTSLLGEILEAGRHAHPGRRQHRRPGRRAIDESTDDTWSVSKSPAFNSNHRTVPSPASPSSSTSRPTTSTAMAPSKTTRSPRSASLPSKTSDDFCVLNADNVRAAAAASRSKAQGLLVLARTHGRRRAHGSKGGVIMFRRPRRRAREHGHAADRASRSRANTTSRMCWPPSAPRVSPGIRRIHPHVPSSNFKAVEHRLEYVATLNGVEYYNDSKATNVDATAKAIAAFPGNIHLILGGKDKNSDYTAAFRTCCAHASKPSTPSARPRPKSSRNCAASSRFTPAKPSTRPSAPALPPRIPATSCCSPPPAPASTSSRATNTAAVSSKS